MSQEYIILRALTYEEMIARVNPLLKQGWLVKDGVNIVVIPTSPPVQTYSFSHKFLGSVNQLEVFYQTLVKPRSNEKSNEKS